MKVSTVIMRQNGWSPTVGTAGIHNGTEEAQAVNLYIICIETHSSEIINVHLFDSFFLLFRYVWMRSCRKIQPAGITIYTPTTPNIQRSCFPVFISIQWMKCDHIILLLFIYSYFQNRMYTTILYFKLLWSGRFFKFLAGKFLTNFLSARFEKVEQCVL
jgi:hypothetical protein